MVFKVADLYVVLYDSIVSNPATGHGREGIYFGENGEHTYYDIAKAVGEGLKTIGKIDNPEPTAFTEEEIVKYLGVSSLSESRLDTSNVEIQSFNFVGANSRARANRSRSIGWKPVKTTKDFLDSIRPGIVAALKKSEEA